MSDSMVLLVYKDNYADEFDVHGFAFLKLDDWEYIKREAAETKFPKEIYFGSNEYMEYDDAKEFINAFKVSVITPEAIDELKRFFYMNRPGETLFGICPYHGCEGNASEKFYQKEGSRLL